MSSCFLLTPFCNLNDTICTDTKCSVAEVFNCHAVCIYFFMSVQSLAYSDQQTTDRARPYMDSLWDTSDSSIIVEQSGVEVIGLFLGSSLSVDQ